MFNYPVIENLGGAGCVDGRQGEFIFICDESADPYKSADFYQDPGSNPCTYHTTLRTKYACADANANDALTNDGLSGGWTFIIILTAILFGYCLIGYLIAGYRTKQWTNFKENLPQCNTFWVYLPRLVMAGCSVSFQFVQAKLRPTGEVDTSELIDED